VLFKFTEPEGSLTYLQRPTKSGAMCNIS